MSLKGVTVGLFCAALPSGAIGQAATRGDPADAQSAAAPLAYESVFKGYRAFTDEKVVSWRATNDLVQKLGGWRAFARDNVPDIPPVTASADEPAPKAASPAPTAASPTNAPAKPTAPGHAGHK